MNEHLEHAPSTPPFTPSTPSVLSAPAPTTPSMPQAGSVPDARGTLRTSAATHASVEDGAASGRTHEGLFRNRDPEWAATADEPAIAAIAIEWFDAHARDLPWRRPDAGAWGVLVSEIMLQQTPVSRVLPTYEGWLARWPTPADLADDEPAEAIRAWGRLGYPRRALRLHACAVKIVEEYGGVVPAEVDALAKLPGIGRYTAHAVAAFAYRLRHPVVDTNVRRFVSRVAAGVADGGPATTSADLSAAESLLPLTPSRAARASAAFMELGALVCTAQTPRCHDCPLSSRCAWRAAGSPPATGPIRRPQTYAGTDRQIRGRLLAILRDATGPLPSGLLDAAWPDAVRRSGALASLLDDGLAVEITPGHFALGGTRTPAP